MLHSGILPHHPKWAKLFENLRFVVIDELHAYRGVFGSHLANVLRRLQRICRHYGSDPVFICSSATIANPRELAERLAERPVHARGRQRRATRREAVPLRQPAGRQQGARHPPVVSQRSAPRRGGIPQAAASADRLLSKPPVDGDPHDLPERRLRGPAGNARDRCAAIAAAICRCAVARSSAGCARGRCAPSSRPTRSSSASTSARSTSR